MISLKNSVILLVLSAALYFGGCDSSSITGSNQKPINYEIPSWDYSDNCFIPDTLYKTSIYEYNNITALTGQYTVFEVDNMIRVNNPDFEIWIQCDVSEPTKRFAVAYTQLYPKPAGGYPDSLKNSNLVPGLQYSGYFKKLLNADYFINDITGLIIFKINIPNEYHAGIAYTSNNGKIYGMGSTNSGTDTLILKMFKVVNCSPDETPLAWDLKLKNIYKIPYHNLTTANFTLDIYFKNNNQYANVLPSYSTPLITMFKMDRLKNNTLSPPPDSLFDFLPGFTIIPDLGYVIFPDLKPFRDCLSVNGIDTAYFRFSEIYFQRKTEAMMNPKANMYFLRGYGE